MKNIQLQKLAYAICLGLLSNAVSAQTDPPPPPSIDAVGQRTATSRSLTLPVVVNNLVQNLRPFAVSAIINETVWDGNSWSNGYPDYHTRIVLNASLNT